MIVLPRARRDRASAASRRSSGVVLPAQELGKYKMIFQMFALEALLMHYRVPDPRHRR